MPDDDVEEDDDDGGGLAPAVVGDSDDNDDWDGDRGHTLSYESPHRHDDEAKFGDDTPVKRAAQVVHSPVQTRRAVDLGSTNGSQNYSADDFEASADEEVVNSDGGGGGDGGANPLGQTTNYESDFDDDD